MLRLECIIFFLLIILPSGIIAQQQDYVFQHLTAKDGLTSDITRFIFQDSKGFYWIGYDNGFQKFDGKNFSNTSFKNEYVKSNILDGSLITPIEDKKGNVFVYNQGSIYVYNSSRENVDTIQIFDYPNNGLGDILSFCRDEWDNIWLVSEKGIYKYDDQHHTCVLWLAIAPRAITNGMATIIYDTHKKSFWLARDNNILLIDIHSKKISYPFLNQHQSKSDLPEGTSFIGFWMDSWQNLWIGSWNGSIYKYNTLTYKKEKFEMNTDGNNKNQTNKSIPFSFLEDKHKHIWIGCYNGGLYVYDERTNLMNAVAADNNIPHALHYDYFISDLCEDNEGNIWAGTDKGINVFNPSLQQFNTIDENNPATHFQKADVIKIFETISGNILVGTWGRGWFMYDKNFQLKKQFYYSTISSLNDDEYRKNFVWCFAEAPDGKIWIGYQHGLIGIFNPINQQIEYINVPEFNKKTVKAIQCDGKGNMWMGLHSGFLVKWDFTLQKFFVYKHSEELTDRTFAIDDILIDKQGEIWVATDNNGFYCFNPESEKITAHYAEKDKHSIFDNAVHALTQINDSVIGISNKSKGFILFNQKQKTFTSFTTQNGLPSNSIFGLGKDKQNNVWIAADNELTRMNEKSNKMVLFEEEDGLLMKGFEGNITTLDDGRMAIPAATGFIYFSPDKINILPEPPDVKITGFTVYDKPLFIDSILLTSNEIDLEHTQNFISINFSSISFLGRNSTQYFYQLQGIDKNWVSAGTQRFASYTNLNPGHYIFKVRCENRDGIPSKNITTLSIYIQPPWWFTWWAYCIYALLTVSIVYTLYKNRIRQLENKQAAQIKAMVATQEEERKRISRDLHDDVGTKLSALKLFLSSLHEKASDTNNEEIKSLAKSSEQFIKEAIQDVRQLLLNLSPSILEEFGYTTAVEGLINKINETQHIHFSLIIFGMSQRLQKDYELALYRITQELINNVLKHAEANNVSLQIGERDEKIILMIEDDGKGFDVNAHKDGYGLNNLEARTKLMQGTMTIDSHAGKGTSVLIEIPYHFKEV